MSAHCFCKARHGYLLSLVCLIAWAGTLPALMAIARNEGVGALYAGVWLTWVKQAPQYAVTFLCYDLAKAWLAAENGNGKHPPILDKKNSVESQKQLPAPQ
jgi:hypothetical protein